MLMVMVAQNVIACPILGGENKKVSEVSVDKLWYLTFALDGYTFRYDPEFYFILIGYFNDDDDTSLYNISRLDCFSSSFLDDYC